MKELHGSALWFPTADGTLLFAHLYLFSYQELYITTRSRRGRKQLGAFISAIALKHPDGLSNGAIDNLTKCIHSEHHSPSSQSQLGWPGSVQMLHSQRHIWMTSSQLLRHDPGVRLWSAAAVASGGRDDESMRPCRLDTASERRAFPCCYSSSQLK